MQGIQWIFKAYSTNLSHFLPSSELVYDEIRTGIPDHLVRYIPKILDMVALTFEVMEGMINFVHLETLFFMVMQHASDALNSHIKTGLSAISSLF